MRTYTLRVGAVAEAVKLYQELGFLALHKEGHDKHLVDYPRPTPGRSTSLSIYGSSRTTPTDAHWVAVFANKDFVEGFASRFRPLVMTQEVKLLQAAPWEPHP